MVVGWSFYVIVCDTGVRGSGDRVVDIDILLLLVAFIQFEARNIDSARRE